MARAAAQAVERDDHCRTVQPARERGVRGEAMGVLREAGEDILRDFLGQPGIARTPQRHAIHKARIPPEQGAKRRFIAALGPCRKEMLVGQFAHVR